MCIPSTRCPSNRVRPIQTGFDGFIMTFGSDVQGNQKVQVAGANSSPEFTLNGSGNSCHNYKLVYRAYTDTASFWIDGTQQFAGLTGQAASYASQPHSLPEVANTSERGCGKLDNKNQKSEQPQHRRPRRNQAFPKRPQRGPASICVHPWLSVVLPERII
jgi:hypothetical protein